MILEILRRRTGSLARLLAKKGKEQGINRVNLMSTSIESNRFLMLYGVIRTLVTVDVRFAILVGARTIRRASI